MNEEKTAAYERLTPQRKQLVDAVLKNLENGTGLWEQGWAGGDAPVSAITGKQYNNGSRSSRINDGIEELDGFCDMGTIAGWKFDLMAYEIFRKLALDSDSGFKEVTSFTIQGNARRDIAKILIQKYLLCISMPNLKVKSETT